MFEFLSPRQHRPGDSDRDRGVSEIIGAILLFGLLLLLLVVVQATAVPTWNQQEEFEHSQRVQTDLQTLDADADAVAADGTTRTTVVEAGVRYPSRPFLINPPPASGRLELEDSGNVTVANADLVGVDNYWDDRMEFPTRTLTYRANYREYRNGPTAYYESGILYNEYGSEEIFLSTHRPVDGQTIDLRVFDGQLSRSSDGSVSVDVRSTSSPPRSVTIRSTGATRIAVEFPTRLDAATLEEEVFAGQVDGSNSSATAYVDEIQADGTTATVYLEPGEYTLQMSEVGFGTTTPEGATYLTADADNRLIRPDTTTDLTAEVRDRYNNPVAGVEVSFALVPDANPDGTLSRTTATTGPDGRATVTYEAFSANTTDNVTASASVNADPADFPDAGTHEWAIETNTEAPAGGGTVVDDDGAEGPEDAVSTLNPGDGDGLPYVVGSTPDGGGVYVCLANSESNDWEFNESRISFYATTGGGGGGGVPTTVDVSEAPGDSPVQTLTIGGTYRDVSALGTLPAESGGSPGRAGLFLDFGGTSTNEFFVVSFRFDNLDQGNSRTVSYLIPARPSGVCSAP